MCDSITINPETGTVRLKKALDYAEVQRLEYIVQATDGNNASTTAELTINVIDHKAQGPRFNATQYTAVVLELSTNLIPAITVYVSNKHCFSAVAFVALKQMQRTQINEVVVLPSA